MKCEVVDDDLGLYFHGLFRELLINRPARHERVNAQVVALQTFRPTSNAPFSGHRASFLSLALCPEVTFGAAPGQILAPINCTRARLLPCLYEYCTFLRFQMIFICL